MRYIGMKTWVALLGLTLAACAQHKTVQQMQGEAETDLGMKFTYHTVEELFVVASNADARVTQRSMDTVRNVYTAMYREFMTVRPKSPVKVYLFADKESYDAYCRKAYGKPPSTIFGFYMPHERKMVMNIETGAGTLAHEMVHPLIEADFPNVPSWFNEGFASLFEQSRYLENGLLRGMTNWRLQNLQRAIRAKECPSLATTVSTTRDEFYGPRSDLNYAVARYLCYYLQEHDLLQKFYKSFRENFKEDRTGTATLEKVLGQKLDDFDKQWREWVLTLKYE